MLRAADGSYGAGRGQAAGLQQVRRRQRLGEDMNTNEPDTAQLARAIQHHLKIGKALPLSWYERSYDLGPGAFEAALSACPESAQRQWRAGPVAQTATGTAKAVEPSYLHPNCFRIPRK